MKKIILISIALFSIKNETLAQYQIKFDSLKVYSMSYYSESAIKIDASLLMAQGDTTLITDTTIINKIYRGLLSMKKRTSNEHLRTVRKNFSKYSVDVRAVFVFYSKLTQKTIGISRQSFMVIDGAVFIKKDIELEGVVKPSVELYKNLFPTKEEIINKK